MKALFLSALLLFSCSTVTAVPPFVKSGRVVSVTQCFEGAGVHWTTWAVSSKLITVYSESGDSASQPALLAEVQLTDPQYAAVLSAAAKTRKLAAGSAWRAVGVDDGVELGICFTEDGSRSSSDVALANTCRDEVTPLIQQLCSLLPPTAKITYEDVVKSAFQKSHLRVEKLTIDEFDGNLPKKKSWWRFWE
jgi:hypothetical protein